MFWLYISEIILIWICPRLEIYVQMYPHLAIYFGALFGRYLTFRTLTSVGRKNFFSMAENAAAVSCCIPCISLEQGRY